MGKQKRKRLLWSGAFILFLAYSVSYFIVTQDRYEQFRALHAPGFWYVPWEAETSESWDRKEEIVAAFFSPLNYVEYDIFGFGMPHAMCSPFFGLGR